jgi:DICT domain-containing protein
VKQLAIKDVAEQTGLAAGTIRMWEQRFGFPEPARTPGGYRVYTPEDVAALRRVVAYRRQGLSVPAALERARSHEGATDRPSLFAALAGGDTPVRPQRLHKPTLIQLSRAIEEEALARAAGPVVFASFQAVRNFRAVEHRYRRLARVADACVVFGRFAAVAEDADLLRVPVAPEDSLWNEWAVVIDAPGYAACLSGWETPESAREPERPVRERVFEAVWTMDPAAVRQAAQVAAALTVRLAPEAGERVLARLADRPLAVEQPAPGLTALSNRIVAYLDAVTAG